MRKSEVYSWRLSPETKNALALQARRERTSLSSLLDRIARGWLEKRRGAAASDQVEQARLHAAARRTIGRIAGGNPRRSEQARRAIRERIKAGRAA